MKKGKPSMKMKKPRPAMAELMGVDALENTRLLATQHEVAKDMKLPPSNTSPISRVSNISNIGSTSNRSGTSNAGIASTTSSANSLKAASISKVPANKSTLRKAEIPDLLDVDALGPLETYDSENQAVNFIKKSQSEPLKKISANPRIPPLNLKSLPTEKHNIYQEDVAEHLFYPLTTVKKRKQSLLSRSRDMIEDFSGMAQLTDLALYGLLMYENNSPVPGVQSVNLTGCVNVTDVGIQTLAKLFPNLRKVVLAGCYRVTQTGLHALLSQCKKMEELDITGTNVSILPVSAASIKVNTSGYPCVSPEAEVLKKNGLQIMKASSYAKPPDEDIMKVCVVNSPGTKYSLVKYLKGDKSLSCDTLSVLPKFKINSRFTANFLECNESVLEIMVTPRTLYVFPVLHGEDPKLRASEIFALISLIIVMVEKAVFVVAGIEKGQDKAPLADVVTEIKALAKQTSSTLLDKVQAALSTAGSKPDVKIGDSIESQKALMSKLVLSAGLGKLESWLSTLNIKVDTPCKVAEDLKPLAAALDLTCKENPAFQDMAGPVHKLIMTHNVSQMIPNGAMAADNCKTSTVKLMELIEIVGLAVCLRPIDENTLAVALPDWLSQVLNTACKPVDKNNGRLIGLPDDRMVWKGEDLIAALEKSMDKQKAELGSRLPLKLGLSVYSTMFIPYGSLPDQPGLPLESYFPEIPPFSKRSDQFFTVGYEASLGAPLPVCVFQHFMHVCCRLRKWAFAWKYGFITHIGNVELLVLWRDREKQGSSLCVYGHVTKNGVSESIMKESVWNQVLQHKVALDYILHYYNLPYDIHVFDDRRPVEGTSALVYAHPFQMSTVEGVNTISCMQCGTNPKLAGFLWSLYQTLSCTPVEEQAFHDVIETSQKKGGLVTLANSATMLSTLHLDPNQSNRVSVQLIAGEKKGLLIGLSYKSYTVTVDKNKAESNGMFLDFDKSALVKKKTEEEDQVMAVAPDKMPATGDIVTFILNTDPKNNLFLELNILRNQESIISTQIVCHDYMLYMKGSTTTLSVLPCTAEKAVDKSSMQLSPGMRLEAKDKQNPQLICVATVDQIFPDGKLNIHFDGWTARYDYVCEPTDPDLHPIGYMKFNKSLPNQNPQLQAPNGYKRQFNWISYCKEMKQLPVPYTWFSEEQKAETKDDVWLDCLQSLGERTISSCYVMKNRPAVTEFHALQKCRSSSKLLDSFTEMGKYLCLLPCGLNVNLLRYPGLRMVTDMTNQNVHIVCPGQKMDLLHFVDDEGVQFVTPGQSQTDMQDSWLCLQYNIIGLLFQQAVLPANCTKLIPGIDKLDNMPQVDMWMQKLLFMSLCNLEVMLPKTQPTSISMSKMFLDVFKAALKEPHVASQFSQDSRFVRCKAHSVSSMANANLREINLTECAQVFQFMTRVDFQNNQIEKVPDEFFTHLIALESLNLSKNKITSLPLGIGKLPEVSDVNISYNQLTALPSDFGNLFATINYLDVSHNPFDVFPEMIFKFHHLEELFAENVGTIKDLSGLKNLKALKILCLGYNLIESIPDVIGTLPLTTLDLSGVPWVPVTNYPSLVMFTNALKSNNVTGRMTEEEIKKLYSKADVDESSDLSREEIQDLNMNILFSKYSRFGQKKLAYEKTGGIPEAIFKIKTLEKLVLCFHGIKMAPDNFKELPSLKELDLSHNPHLLSLSAELGALSLKQLHVLHCGALNTPPKEIVRRGFLAVMGYLKRLRLGASPCKRTKLMMVGLGGAGKTSLVQSLMKKRYRAYMDYDEPITDGIQINKWEVELEADDKLTYSVWDFAGQTVYYNTHQFFLSNRAVYLLLWNVRQGYEHAGLDFWLSSIACHAPKAPILIIGTHIDKVDRYRLPEETLKARYPQISGFHYVSCYTGVGVQELREVIIKQTLQQKYMGEKIPEAWLTLEKKLITYRDEKTVDILPFKTLEALGASCGVFDRNELIQAVQFLHDLGALQFFDTDFLRSMVVIYPQWIVDVMACLVTVQQGYVQDGKIMLKDLLKVWEAYPTELHPWLLRLTEEFDLTCPLPDEEASIVPCLLPDTEPKFDWPHADPGKNIRESLMVYKFQYLPAGLFNRAQVRLHQYSNGALLWKRGSYMKKNNHIAVMTQSEDQEVIVRAQGFRPENFLFIVHEMFETLITESYGGVDYDYLVPCLDCLNMNVKDPSMMSHNKVKRALELNVPFIQCEKFFHISSLEALKVSMPSDKLTSVDSHLQNSVNELKNLNDQTTISTFFIYSSKNVPDLREAESMVHPGTILEDLRKQHFIKVSYTDKPESSDMEAFTLTIKSCSVVMIGMSDEFCTNPECKKLLMYIKDVLQKRILLVLLGKTKAWQKGDLNMHFGTEVYVDMMNKGRYEHKIKELYEAIKKKAAAALPSQKDSSIPKVFISYCWSNSHDAIAKGSKRVDGALGWEKGDPRKVKAFFTEKGITCWIDVEKVGGVGLFHSIADGLKDAEVMVAFVSDEYVRSKNCVMEFRYALATLKIPVIVVMVGTGLDWMRSEVGLLAVGHKCPKVNFQFDNEPGYLELLRLVQDNLADVKSSGSEDNKSVTNQRNVAFQEVLELTQRKFLRHITSSILSNDLEPYPALLVVDLATTRSEKKPTEAEESREPAKEGKEKADVAPVTSPDTMEEPAKFCFRFLCEDVRGWHVMPNTLKLPDESHEEQRRVAESAAPYLSRLYTISKHAYVQLECLTTPEGEIFQQLMEEIALKGSENFKEEYLELRNLVMQVDSRRTMGDLHKCLVNGKHVWLCDHHKRKARSKTEERYGDKLSQKEADIPIADMPESFATDAVQEPEAPKDTKPKKMFRRNISSQKPNIQRQTSQMCSVM